jgi:diacylglycerol kinase
MKAWHMRLVTSMDGCAVAGRALARYLPAGCGSCPRCWRCTARRTARPGAIGLLITGVLAYALLALAAPAAAVLARRTVRHPPRDWKRGREGTIRRHDQRAQGAHGPEPHRQGLLQFLEQGCDWPTRGESAFRQELWLAGDAVAAGVLAGRNWVEVALLAGSVLLVLIVELLNSGIEAVVDRVSLRDLHELSKRAKDYGSAACCCRCCCAAASGAPRLSSGSTQTPRLATRLRRRLVYGSA